MAKLKDGKAIREQMYSYLVGRYTGVTAPNWSLKKMLDTAYRFESEERTLNEMRQFIKVNKKMKILDAGCGFGHFVSYCLDQGYNCYGYEVDKNLAKIGKSILKINQQNQNRVSLVKSKRLPYEEQSFDLINLSFVLDYVHDIPALLKELRRILKKDGEIYIEAPNYLCCFSPIYALVFFPWLPKWLNRIYFRLRGRSNTKVIESLTFITPQHLNQIFKQLNFEVKNYGLKFWQDLIDQKNVANRNDKLLLLVKLASRLKLSFLLRLFAKLGFYTPLIYVIKNKNS